MFEATRDVLPNGLRVVTVNAPGLHSAMVAVYVKAGSRHETERTNGVSHFLEHLFFRGCEAFPEGRRMNARVEDVGGALNGVTARDHGYYYTPLHPRHLGVGLETLGAMLTRPLLKEIDLEREVILEEMLDEVDDQGRDIDVDNLAKRASYGAHPLGFKIAGTQDTVKGIAHADVLTHHERFYVARNMVLAVAGPLDRRMVLDLADRHFGALPTGTTSMEEPAPAWPAGPRLIHVRHDESQTEIRISFPTPPEEHPDFAPLLVLRRILDDGLSSRLQVNVVERKGLAYSIGAGLDTFSDTGSFELDVACAHRKVPDTFNEVLTTLGALASDPVPDEELERAKIRHRIGLEFSLDSAAELVGWFGGTELYREPESYEERIRRIDAVTVADVQRVAAATFRREKLLACVVGRLDKATRTRLERLVEEAAPLPR